jgi:hypothetical protein
MQLLIAILLCLGINILPEAPGSPGTPDTANVNVQRAQHIIDNDLYYYTDDGGIVIEDNVDPH